VVGMIQLIFQMTFDRGEIRQIWHGVHVGWQWLEINALEIQKNI
jgi:hypothetical protein